MGELDVMDALQDPDTLVVDGRVRPDWRTGTIPGAINMPYTEMADQLHELGCEPDFEGFHLRSGRGAEPGHVLQRPVVRAIARCDPADH